jgi:predicted CXXCH cytochrome family protein
MEKLTPVCYDEHAYPYFFKDTSGDGACQADEATSANAFKSWTPRLMRAGYNYQLSAKDPGAFAHNAKYIMELLYDSIADLNKALVTKTDMSRAARGDFGHFDGASAAARNWDKDEMVTANCSRCHGASEGFRFFVDHGVSIAVPETANGLDCATCHTSFGSTFDVLAVPSVTFPSGIVRTEPGNDNLCATCHAGRAAKSSIDATIASGKLAFVNVHYLPAAGVKLGAAAAVGYEYPQATYAGPLTHTGGVQCTSCHDPRSSKHSFLIHDAWEGACRSCHADANGDPKLIRLRHRGDYDGDGNTTEPLAQEIAGMAARTLRAMQVAAGTGALCYSPTTHPYFFKDTDANGDGTCSAAEAVSTNRFSAWTPALLKASHNFQLSQKEPGAWAHNFDYIGQLLYDSTMDLSGAVSGMTRP